MFQYQVYSASLGFVRFAQVWLSTFPARFARTKARPDSPDLPGFIHFVQVVRWLRPGEAGYIFLQT